jgi:hypothetical protein
LAELDTANYSLAQFDNYLHMHRHKFPHTIPCRFQLEARVGDSAYKGTWGFGFWNDPFSLGFTAGGMSRVLPVLPNVAWFFYGSVENYLSLKDDGLGAGFRAQTFRAPLLPSFMSILAVPTLPLLIFPAGVRLLRKLLRLVVKEDSKTLQINTKTWHTYSLEWRSDEVVFEVDEEQVFRTKIVPNGRLGLVIWIDNQYFRFDPDGKLKFGVLQIPSKQSLEVRNLTLTGEGGYAYP